MTAQTSIVWASDKRKSDCARVRSRSKNESTGKGVDSGFEGFGTSASIASAPSLGTDRPCLWPVGKGRCDRRGCASMRRGIEFGVVPEDARLVERQATLGREI